MSIISLDVTISNCHNWGREGGYQGQFGHCHHLSNFFFLKASLSKPFDLCFQMKYILYINKSVFFKMVYIFTVK